MAKYLAFPLTLILTIATGSQGAWAVPNASIDSSSVKLAQVNGLVDIQNHWARPFIQGLAASNLVSSSPNSQFRPNQGVTRAEFAAILELSFTILPKVRHTTVSFKDVPPTHWAAAAIQKAYEGGFMAGNPAGTFHPDRLMTRAQAMVSIANGLEIITNPKRTNRALLSYLYNDANRVPDYAVAQIAALSDHRIIVNYPDVRSIAPTRNITRAELAALIYQSLVERGRLPSIGSSYIVNPNVKLNANPSMSSAPVDPAKQITRLEVDLSSRRVTAFQGKTKIKTYKIAVGRSGWETPTGTYHVAQKVERPAWKNPFTGDVIKSGDRDNPLGLYWIGFWTNGKDWSGFHGTPHRETVGQAVSHGCLRMYNEDIKELFSKVTADTVVKVSH